MRKQMLVFGLNLIMVIAIVGCGTNKQIKTNQEMVKLAYEVQKPLTVRTSLDDKRPSWIHKSVFEMDGKLYFSGGFTNGSDYSVSIRCANAEALKTAIQSISQFIRAEFSSYVHGSNIGTDGVDRYVNVVSLI